ncbi:putative nuclease HARBI1 isoform X3 [Macadamia integrifolia]|nr:putative nuclease HARBI1 isoform X3 [Macadamia integrifolia]
MVQLANETIRPPNFDVVPSEIQHNPKFSPFFQDCIGAIDGTHISAIVPRSEQTRYRNRKALITQNVMCACSFDMRFTFVYAGWEGSAHDARVFEEARSNATLGFPHPPPGKYYAVDSGYASQLGYLTPFRGERYHLPDFSGERRGARTPKELFNHRHSSLRNVIERTFGVLKNRFQILQKMKGYRIEDQASIVVACCGLHNYIKEQAIKDDLFDEYGCEQNVIDQLNPPNHQDFIAPTTSTSQRGARQMSMLRINIANQMAISKGMPMIPIDGP